MTENDTQVIEFELNDKRYCVDLNYVAEIVDKGDLTQIPNTPSHIEGVMDLRGETTTIINPKIVFDLQNNTDGKRIIVFEGANQDSDDNIGWIVDEVHQVRQITEQEVDDPIKTENVKGVIKEDGDFVIWVEPPEVHSNQK
ncbi:chemotaxis protein CheW [Methanonatronarchaeum sp. AMET6-2]|uniref:chemotaxis protein CheW n=1 Tax=Methanonatronarchaeum sp. AMET6-2 TaxID=2933293 RepID=UPI0012173B2F|nr:chemotaxis protein CheW [Methanonatronarchaeum sp. AMET6-2]RZN63452.1 MAG: purine-binding chemotaxis protein CheW [Methanonatronarchaeia archaeon]UOY09769.1 chemotaxis protein CheW [Methanonatronarchaeum sp. AMET6-2]